MEEQQYRTVAREGEHETEVKRSRFLTTLAPAATEADARAVIRRVRERHPGATHHCWAYVIGASGAVQKSSDDGEPGGTAGVPMLQMLLRREVRDIVAVVTRWFGGVQLGAGGLIRAYGGAVGQTLDVLGTVARRPVRLATVTVDHQRAGKLENDLRATGRAVREVCYGDRVRIEIGVAEGDLDHFRGWLADATAGTAALELGGVTYVEG
ncbi:YigZ family protein [Streptomyces xinghaiensis]|uniref:YigZ family protein n=2 Tax=Streptomyces TaxID=1883 RepID=A0A3R7HYP2_9ACTN|nr:MULTISPECIES: YigZ family protein [Streptomyces]KNE80974.1 IMPACT family member yvyE [Streptomyces fradiae]OFA47793.1 YigZ family protein [Streptomyces fradiae]PQM21202.1 YigZ family protein [Streptomyces xinghaiensis]RKM93569.1 YigZ family protein [Streptomyces xinghaiensis]RNC71628.1 YigZ family protein [Streptomyces xinghaiensis]